MRSTIVRLVLFGIVAVLAAGVSAQEKKDPIEKYQPDSPTRGIDQVTPQVSEEILIHFVDEPSHHFGLAQEHFLKKDYARSAAEMRKGADFVKLEMTRSSGEGRQALADAAMRLEKLAGAIEGGSVNSVDGINRALARAEQELAFHHELMAEKFWQVNNYLGTGHDLKAASMNLKNSLKYTGGKVEVETEAAIKDADKIGQNLLEGARLADEKVNAALDALGDKIDEARQKMGQSK